MEIKAGLEIHQQLDTHKLFCNCPSFLRKDEPLFSVKRKLNPVTGETGEIDVAVIYEQSKNQEFIYQVYDTNCLLELDEEPPHKINQEALHISLQIALLLNCKIFQVTQVMRKTVIDGSNTSGFQRSVLIGHDGFVETSQGRVGIESIALEEDAARIISKDEKTKTFRLDRLGIPLVEITTKPDLKSSEQVKETALKIGEILRSCNVRRGIGTIRQDLNISIPGSERVEIKGFQDPKMMIETINNEVKRQEECIKNKSSKKEVRRAESDGTTKFLRPLPGKARMYPETDLQLLKISKQQIDFAKKTLPKLKGELRGYLKEYGLNDELIKLILQGDKIEEFKLLIKVGDNANLVAKVLTLYLKEIAVKQGKSLEEVYNILSLDILEGVLSEVDKTISESEVKVVLGKIVSGVSLKDALKKEKINLEEEIDELIKEKPGLSEGGYMGLIMGKFRGKVSGGEVMGVLKKKLG